MAKIVKIFLNHSIFCNTENGSHICFQVQVNTKKYKINMTKYLVKDILEFRQSDINLINAYILDKEISKKVFNKIRKFYLITPIVFS